MRRCALPAEIRCQECWAWVPIEDEVCPECGTPMALTSEPRDEDYDRAELSEAWQRRGGGGL